MTGRMGMTNAQRFIDAYNTTDNALHNRYGFKLSLSFTECVHRAAAVNAVVRKFEDELVDYARLRNAIVHSSNSTRTIAEPHDDVTERFEHIASIIVTPPLASSVAHRAETVDADTPLKSAVAVMNKKGYSNMPVLKDGKIVGMLTNKAVVNFAAENLDGLDAAFAEATVADALGDVEKRFTVMADCPIDAVLEAYEKDKKLTMIIVTEHGTVDSDIIGVITVGDLVTVTKMLEAY